MTDRDDTVKELLGRAFGDEPPLRIDRDQVFEAGRKRLRRRRFLEAGSVVAAVLVAAVGAATLTNLGGTEPERLPPAASSQPTSASSDSQVPAEPSLAPTATSGAAPPLVEDTTPKVDQEQLTTLLYDVGVDAVTVLGGTSEQPDGQPGSASAGGQYVYAADVVRSDRHGQVRITIAAAEDAVVNCSTIPTTYGDCTERTTNDVPVVLARTKGPNTLLSTYAAAVLSNGLRVEVTASNQTSTPDAPPTSTPVLTDDEIQGLVVLVGLSV